MKPLPNLLDTDAMAARGRRSALMAARNEACEALRDACVAVQSADITEVHEPVAQAQEACARLLQIAGHWKAG